MFLQKTVNLPVHNKIDEKDILNKIEQQESIPVPRIEETPSLKPKKKKKKKKREEYSEGKIPEKLCSRRCVTRERNGAMFFCIQILNLNGKNV